MKKGIRTRVDLIRNIVETRDRDKEYNSLNRSDHWRKVNKDKELIKQALIMAINIKDRNKVSYQVVTMLKRYKGFDSWWEGIHEDNKLKILNNLDNNIKG